MPDRVRRPRRAPGPLRPGLENRPFAGAYSTQRRYRLLEFQLQGEPSVEEFLAPDDNEALQRVLRVLPEHAFELWCGRRLVRRRLRA